MTSDITPAPPTSAAPAPSDTLDPMSRATPTIASATPRRWYGAWWRRVPRELGFLLLTLPIALPGFLVTIALFLTGVGTVPTVVVAVVALIAALYVSRGFGSFELVRLGWAGRPPIVRPEWQDARARQGFGGWLRALIGNGHYWLYLLHTMVIAFLVSFVSWTLTVAWLFTVADGLTDWVFNLVDAPWRGESNGPFGIGSSVLGSFGYLVIAIVLLAALPFLTHVLVLMHDAIARGVLGAFRSDALQRQIIAANVSRGAAISAEGSSLRRLERDIHDGPQQRLVRLQMDLAAADRQLDTDPERARAIIAEAMQQSKDALEELRALSRGFAPPILLDRGLVAALESAATRSPVPTRIVSTLAAGAEPPQEIARNAYFVASESITNAVKHAGATSIVVTVGIEQAPRPVAAGGVADVAALVVSIEDDGRGGALPSPTHGLDGLQERLRGLGGSLEISSPVGGPTRVSARFPLP